MAASSSQVRRSAVAGASIVSLVVAGLATIFGSGLTTPIGPAPAAEAPTVQVIAPAASSTLTAPGIRPGDLAPDAPAQPAATVDPGVQYVYVPAPGGEGDEHENGDD